MSGEIEGSYFVSLQERNSEEFGKLEELLQEHNDVHIQYSYHTIMTIAARIETEETVTMLQERGYLIEPQHSLEAHVENAPGIIE